MGIKKNKHGITMWIVALVVLLAGFAVLMWFFLGFLWNQNIDKETCHQSVILRGTSPSLTQEYVPLKCKTQKYCVTKAGNCEDSFGEGEKFARVKVRDSEDIEQFLAREMVDCWNMMGKGKISLFANYWAKTYGIGSVYPTCVICDRVAFDKSLKQDNLLENMDLWKYMGTHKVSGTEISYLEYFGGSVSAKEKFEIAELGEKDGEAVLTGNKENIELVGQGTTKDSYEDLDVLFMQISAPSSSEVIKNTLEAAGLTFGAGVILAPKFTKVVAGGVVRAAGWWMALGAALAGGYQQYSVYANRGITAIYCGDISVGSEAREGCSVVRTVNHDAPELEQYCQVVESVP